MSCKNVVWFSYVSDILIERFLPLKAIYKEILVFDIKFKYFFYTKKYVKGWILFYLIKYIVRDILHDLRKSLKLKNLKFINFDPVERSISFS